MTIKEQVSRLLPLVEKPGRYMGGELNMAVKDPAKVKTRFGFAFPDKYEIGMSYLGLQIIYDLLNAEKDVYCERIFAPDDDMEALMRERELPLFTLETCTPVKELDILGFTLQYELSYTNILNMLDLAGIPFYSKDRGEEYPLISAGGPCAFNPEPLADFVDFFNIGDGEGALQEICRIHREWKATGGTKDDFLKAVSKVPGVYVPKFYEAKYDENGDFAGMEKLWDGAPDQVRKNMVHDLETTRFPVKPLVPLIEVVHDRSVVEIFRGCTRGCRFCQAGMIYRPVRERSKDTLLKLVKEQLANTGHDEVSLLSLSTSDHSQIEEFVTTLMEDCRKNNVALSLPSLRLDSFSFKVMEEIQGYKKTGLTFAPEAGTQRLRDVINKNISEENIYGSMKQAIELGWTGVKLYFMDGLPTETDEDLAGIANVARNIMELYFEHTGARKCGKFTITASVSNFVPKPHTPFQWFPQDRPEEFTRKHKVLEEKFRRLKGCFLQYHGSESSHIEAVLARGDRRASYILEAAFNAGCKFDSWREHFSYQRWLDAIEASGVNADRYAYYSDPTAEKPLPWDIIDSGISKAFLKAEWERSKVAATIPDCRHGCQNCGINKYTVCKQAGVLKGKKEVEG